MFRAVQKTALKHLILMHLGFICVHLGSDVKIREFFDFLHTYLQKYIAMYPNKGPLRCSLSPRKSTPNHRGEVPIILHLIRRNDSRIRVSTGYWIKLSNWDEQKEKAKPSAMGAMELNILLGRIIEKAQLLCLRANVEEIEITRSMVQEEVLGKDPGVQEGQMQPVEYIEFFIQKQRSTLSEVTLKNYTALSKHLQNYCMVRNKKLRFELFTVEFAEDFLNYLIGKNLGNISANKYIKRLKTVLKRASLDGFLDNRDYEQFPSYPEHVDFVYLTSEELQKLQDLDLSSSPELEKARDTFVFQCGCGLRYGDIQALTWDDVKKDHFIITTQKTHQEIRIPINTITRPLLEKYKGFESPIPAYSNQTQNQYLKQLGAMAGLFDRHNKVRFYGKNRVQNRLHKWELLSTHTARRTFVILALERGMRPEVLMRITGHKKLSTLQQYISITDNVVEQEMKMAFG